MTTPVAEIPPSPLPDPAPEPGPEPAPDPIPDPVPPGRSAVGARCAR